MRFQGQLQKHGKFWIVEVPIFDATTQGRTKLEAYDMIADWFITMVGRKGFRVSVRPTAPGEFEISSESGRWMIALLLQRQRQRSGLSLAQVAKRLGARSRNAYARYETGSSVPTVEKLDELLRAVAPDWDIVLHQSRAA